MNFFNLCKNNYAVVHRIEYILFREKCLYSLESVSSGSLCNVRSANISGL